VNTGLGAGTRERDMLMMQQILGLQERLIGAFGADNPYVKPDDLYAALEKLTESAGIKTPGLFFTKPDPAEIQQRMEAARKQPNPEMLKLQASMKLEEAKMQTQQAKERAQMEADLQVKQAEIQADSKRQADELASKALLQEQKLAFDREKFAEEMAFKREQLAIQRQDEIHKFQAETMAREADRQTDQEAA